LREHVDDPKSAAIRFVWTGGAHRRDPGAAVGDLNPDLVRQALDRQIEARLYVPDAVGDELGHHQLDGLSDL
jgi:hypothetical protein